MPNNTKLISILGAGHLGSALLRGLIKSGYPKSLLTASNRNPHKLTHLAELGINTSPDNVLAAQDADILVLAVKPQFMHELCTQIAATVQAQRPLIISLAGVTEIKQISQWLGLPGLEIVRVMTNTPMEFTMGCSALFASTHVTPKHKEYITALFQAVGSLFWVTEEQLLDPLTAAIGSAPAYVLLFMEALQKAAVSQGIPEEFAKQIAFDVFAGTAALAKHSQRSFAELRAGVTTPNGITEHSLKELAIDEFFSTFAKVYQAANERIEQIKNDPS